MEISAKALPLGLIVLALGGCSLRPKAILSPGLGGGSLSAQGSGDEPLRQAFAAAGIQTPVPSTPSAAMVKLGKSLFYDKILSANQDTSCATCHQPTCGAGDDLPLSIGTGGSGLCANRQLKTAQMTSRNALPVSTLGLSPSDVNTMMWDGAFAIDPTTGILSTPEAALNGNQPTAPEIVSLVDSGLTLQALFPPTNAVEMLGQPGTNALSSMDRVSIWRALTTQVLSFSGYQSLFSQAFPSTNFSQLNFGHIAESLAAFEIAAFTRVGTPVDQFLAGNGSALSDADKSGAALFLGKAKCAQCHNGPLLSDFQFHGLAMPQLGPGKLTNGDDTGRAVVTSVNADEYKFRTPTLRNVCKGGPWSHAGAYSSLSAVVQHHLNPAQGLLGFDPNQIQSPTLRATLDTNSTRNEARIEAIDPILAQPIALSSDELASLVGFLCDGLSDPGTTDQNALAAPPASVPSGLAVN